MKRSERLEAARLEANVLRALVGRDPLVVGENYEYLFAHRWIVRLDSIRGRRAIVNVHGIAYVSEKALGPGDKRSNPSDPPAIAELDVAIEHLGRHVRV